MFVLKPRGDTAETAWQPVTIAVPEGERVREARIRVKYRLLRQSEIDEALGEADDGLEDDIGATIAFIARVVDDWAGMQCESADGEVSDLPCTHDNIERACDVVAVRQALLNGFFMAVSGRGQAARARRHRKNS